MVTLSSILFLFWNYFCITRIFSLETSHEEKLLIMEQDDPVLVESKFFERRSEGLLRIMNSIQLNEYETAPHFIQFSQNLTCDCLLIYVFCPEFT